MNKNQILKQIEKKEPLIDWEILPSINKNEVWVIGDGKIKVKVNMEDKDNGRH